MKSLFSAALVLVCVLVVAGCAPMAAPTPAPPTPVPPTAAPTPAADLTAPVKAWVDALNKGDVEAALALFTDNVSAPGFLDAGNKDDLRLSSQYLVDRQSKFGTPDCAPGSGGLVCSFTWREGCIAAFGATDGLGMRGTFDIQPDGKIRKATVMKDGAEWAEYALWENKFEAWARANRAEEWIKRDRPEFAPEYVKLCKEYAESVKAPATPAADLAAPVKAWVDAINKGDVEAALAPFADSVWWTASYQGNAFAKEHLRSLFDTLTGLETKHQIKDCQPQGDVVTCTFSIVDGCIAAYGAPDGLPEKLDFKFQRDRKIGEASMTADDPKWKDYSDWTGAVTAWAAKNRAEDLDIATGEGRESGAAFMKLCKEYAESLKAKATASPPSTAAGDVKLTILYDNTAMDSQLGSDWGFAALVEYGGHTVLFDAGANGPILTKNMQQLNVKPESIEAVIISHEHSDHTAGLQALLNTGIRPKVYAPSAFSNTFKEQVRARTELVEVTDPLTIVPGMHLTRPVGSIIEQALVVETRDGTVVILGCAHPGLAEMVRQAQEVVPGKVSLLAGGFHLLEIADKDRLQSIIAELRELGVERVLPTHCTGDAAMDLFHTEFGEGYIEGGVGRTVTSSAD